MRAEYSSSPSRSSTRLSLLSLAKGASNTDGTSSRGLDSSGYSLGLPFCQDPPTRTPPRRYPSTARPHREHLHRKSVLHSNDYPTLSGAKSFLVTRPDLRQFPETYPYHRFAEWGRIYGPMTYLNLAGQPMVIINTQDAAVDLLEKRAAIYSDRARSVMTRELCGTCCIHEGPPALSRRLCLPLIPFVFLLPWRRI